MKKILITVTLVLGILLTGCSDAGVLGSSKIIFMEDGMADLYATSGIGYTITAEIEGYDWDGEYDYNFLLDGEPDCVTDLPNHSITPGTYDYTVTITTTESSPSGGTVETTEMTFCTSNSFCPDGGVVAAYNAPLVVTPNLEGTDAPDLFTDGDPGADFYYIFYVSYTGMVIATGGVADCD